MHLTANTKWRTTGWLPARSRWPTIVTDHLALESWSAEEPSGCLSCDFTFINLLIPLSFLAFMAQSHQDILEVQGPAKEGTLSFMWSWTFIETKATSGSHEVPCRDCPWLSLWLFWHRSRMLFYVHYPFYPLLSFTFVLPSVSTPLRRYWATFKSFSAIRVNLRSL